MSCTQKRKPKCTGPECQWIVATGCRPTNQKETGSKMSSTILTKDMAASLFLWHGKPVAYSDEVLDILNDFLHHVCLKIIPKPNKKVTILDIDTIVKRTFYHKTVIANAEATVMEYLRNNKYDDECERYITKTYSPKFARKEVSIYLIGVLIGYIKSFLMTYYHGKKFTVATFVKFLDYDVNALYTFMYYGFRHTLLQGPRQAPKHPVRLPQRWVYVEDELSEGAVTKLFKNKWMPGDIIFPEDGYRNHGVYLVNEDNKAEEILASRNGEVYIPPWAISIGIKNGFQLDDIIQSYRRTPVEWLLLPREFQKDVLQIDEYNKAITILGHNFGKEDTTMSWDDVDEDDKNVTSLFRDGN